jgi:hypothetical protein
MTPTLATKTVLVEMTVEVPAGRSNEAVLNSIDKQMRPLQASEQIVVSTFAASTIGMSCMIPAPEPEAGPA